MSRDANGKETPHMLQCIRQNIWTKGDFPDDWKKGVIIKLPKKGYLGDCSNWRGNTLLAITSKVYQQSFQPHNFTAYQRGRRKHIMPIAGSKIRPHIRSTANTRTVPGVEQLCVRCICRF